MSRQATAPLGGSMTDTRPDTESQVPTVCGIELPGFPRPFTLREQALYNDIADLHGLEEARSDYTVGEGRTELDRRNARLEAVRANLKALDKRRQAEWERDDPRPDVIDTLTDQWVKTKEEETDLTRDDLVKNVTAVREQEARAAEFIELQERVYLETVHALAGLHGVKVPKLPAFMEAATPEDHDAVAVIVEEGVAGGSPLSRAGRRAAARRERQRASRSRPSQAD